MKTYRITVGNTTARKGHRRDCGQLSAVFDVPARDTAHALERLRNAGYWIPPLFLGIECRLELGAVDARDVQELK